MSTEQTDRPARPRPDTPWSDRPTPTTAEEWLERAAEVGAVLAVDAVERDHAGLTPHSEVRLLKDSGLATLLGPVEHGGGGQTWQTAYRVAREVSKADGSIGQLLGYHYLWAWAVRFLGTPEQIAAVEELYTTNRYFFGGAVNPRDDDLTITSDGDHLVFNGRKTFSTGSRVSDLTVLEACWKGRTSTSSPSSPPPRTASSSATTGTTSASASPSPAASASRTCASPGTTRRATSTGSSAPSSTTR